MTEYTYYKITNLKKTKLNYNVYGNYQKNAKLHSQEENVEG